MPHEDALTISLLTRAFENGFDACILTTDTWQLGWRHDDIATGNYAFYRGIGADLGLSDPVFQRRSKLEGIDPEKEPERAGALWIHNVWHGRAWSWEKIPWLRDTWKRISGRRPFCIKGIQSVSDARKCVELGVDGIVVSNHAGRQVDGAIASLDALEDIVAAVGDQIYIMYDSGIRGASDIVKALALGAKFVWVGRLWVWGLSIMGEAGVRHVMRSLLADFDILMNVAGFQNVEQMREKGVLGMFILLGFFFIFSNFPFSLVLFHTHTPRIRPHPMPMPISSREKHSRAIRGAISISGNLLIHKSQSHTPDPTPSWRSDLSYRNP